MADNKITQNETLTMNNGSQFRGIQAGLTLLEVQVNTNAAATAELRTDVQNTVATVVQKTQRPTTGVHAGANGTGIGHADDAQQDRQVWQEEHP